MKQLIIQHPVLLLIIWTALNFLYYFLNLLQWQLYKRSADFDSRYGPKSPKRRFLKLLPWIGFGIVWLSAIRQVDLKKPEGENEYFIYVGAFFFLIIGYLLIQILSLGRYFVYRREMTTKFCSPNTSRILTSLEFFGYSALILLSYLISKDPLLLGGIIGLAFGGIMCLFKTKKANR